MVASLKELSDKEVQALIEIARARVNGTVSKRDLLRAGGLAGALGLAGGGLLESTGGASASSSYDGTIEANSFKGNQANITGLASVASLDAHEIGNVVRVASESDLPSPTNGKIYLKPSTAYHFEGFITSKNTLVLASKAPSPIVGTSGGIDGFIHTGGRTAIEGTNAHYLSENLYVHAPGGTIFNLTGDNTTEMLVVGCAYSDAAGIGNIASLGTIDGYRVPTWESCDFEDFNSGLTFTGSPNKVFITQSPLRRISASGVTMLTFDSNFNADIVDIVDNYFKEVQSDTKVVDVSSSATISEVFSYRGNIHDTSVTRSNILTGAAGTDVTGYNVTNSYPIADSTVIGSLSLDSSYTVTVSTQGTFYPIGGSTTVGPNTIRIVQSSNGILQYKGEKDTYVQIIISATVSPPNGTVVKLALAKNRTINNATKNQVTGQGNTPVSLTTSGMFQVFDGDTFSARIANNSGTSNITIDSYNLSIQGH